MYKILPFVLVFLAFGCTQADQQTQTSIVTDDSDVRYSEEEPATVTKSVRTAIGGETKVEAFQESAKKIEDRAKAIRFEEEKTIAAREFRKLKRKVDPDIRGLYDPVRGHYKLLYGNLSFREKGTPRQMAERFLRRHSELLNLPGFSRNAFKHIKTERGKKDGPTYVRYRQYYKNVPVYGSVLTVAVDGIIKSVDTTHSSNLPDDLNTIPKYSFKHVISIANKTRTDLVDWKNNGLFVYADDKGGHYYLVYNLEAISAKDDFFRWNILIDAHTGIIVYKEPITVYTNSNNVELIGWTDYLEDPFIDEITPALHNNTEGMYELYTGENFNPATISTYDCVGFAGGTCKDSVSGVKKFNVSAWPLGSLSNKYDFFALRVHTNVYKILNYFKETYDQMSWGDCNGKPCQVKAYANAKFGAAGMYMGGNSIAFSKYKSHTRIFVVGHEFGHGFVRNYFEGKLYGYKNKTYPEAQGIEEGVAILVGCLSKHHYLEDGKWTCQDGNKSYEQYYDKLDLTPGENNGSHDFGYIITDISGDVIKGLLSASGTSYYGLDVEHLFKPNDVGWLIVEMIRHKHTWRDDMLGFANASMATCMERVGTLFTEEQCKNLEIAFILKGIAPGEGYGVDPLMSYKKKLYVDLKLKTPKIAEIKKTGNGEEYIYMKLGPEVTNLQALSSEKFSENEILNVGIEGHWNYGVPQPENIKLFSDVNFYEEGYAWGKIGNYYRGYCFEPPEPMPGSFAGYFCNITLPIIDKIAMHSFHVAPSHFAYGPAVIADSNIADNTQIFILGPNFEPGISIAPINYDISTTTPFKWEVTVEVKNTGTKPTYPVVDVSIFNSESSDINVEGYLNNLKNSIKEHMDYDWKYKTSPWLVHYNEWKEKGDESGQKIVINDAIEQIDCAPSYPTVVLPGEKYCAKKFIIKAKVDDEFLIILDKESAIPELNEMDNIKWVKLKEKDETVYNYGSLNKPTEMKKFNIIESLYHRIDDFKQIPEHIDEQIDPVDPYGMLFDFFMFGQGEKVVLPPDQNGKYQPGKFPDSYMENQKTFDEYSGNRKP